MTKRRKINTIVYSLIALHLIIHLGVPLAFLLIPEKTTEILVLSSSAFDIGGCLDENKNFELCTLTAKKKNVSHTPFGLTIPESLT